MLNSGFFITQTVYSGLCEFSSASDERRRSQRPQSDEIQLFQLSVTQKDRERFAEVTDDAIATDDLLHFDVYRTDKVTKSHKTHNLKERI